MAKRPIRHADSRDFDHWLDRAREDLICAQVLAELPECGNNSAFHAQQTVEKALKAYLLYQNRTLVDGHNLVYLCKKAGNTEDKFRDWLGMCVTLNRCYIETRYPADIPLDIGVEQARSYCATALELYDFVCAQVAPGHGNQSR